MRKLRKIISIPMLLWGRGRQGAQWAACPEVQVHPFENNKETLEDCPFSAPLHTGCFSKHWEPGSPSHARFEQVCGAACPSWSWHRSPEPLTPRFCSWREREGGLQQRLFTLPCCIYSCFVSHSSQGKSKGQLVTAETNGGSGKDTAGCSYLEEILNKHHHQEPFYLPRSIKIVTYSNSEKQQNYFCFCAVSPIWAFLMTFPLSQQTPHLTTESN